jgi:hypothetical protein
MSQLTEYGRPRPGSVGAWAPRLVVAGAVLTIVLGTAWQLVWEHHQVAQSTADEHLSALVGPPCPAVSAAAFQSAVKAGAPGLRYIDHFNGVTFGRSFGDGDCSVAAQKGDALGSYVVCQFSGPDALYVQTARGASYFMPGIGQKATIMTPGGVAKCVMTAPKWNAA